MGKNTQTGSTGQEQKKKEGSKEKSKFSLFKRSKSEQAGKENAKKPSEDAQKLKEVTKEVKKDAKEQKQGKVSPQSKETKEKTAELKKKVHHHHHRKSSHSKSEKSDAEKAKTSTSDKMDPAKKVNQKIQERKEAYDGYKAKIDTWKTAKNKHSLVDDVVSMQQEMKAKDEELTSFTETESKIIVNASGSANVVKDFESVANIIQEKYADKKQVRTMVTNNKGVYDMVMHVGEVGDARREVYAKAEKTLNRKYTNELNAETDESKKEDIKKRQEENRDADLEKEVQLITMQGLEQPTQGQEAKEGAKKVGSFALQVEEWIGNLFGNYSDISDVIENKGELDKKIKELRETHKINAEPPEIGEMEFGAKEGLGCGLAAFNFIKTLIETVKAGVDTIKDRKIIDNQEYALRFREFFGNVLDLIGNVIDFAGPWIDMVPFLGSCLSILQNAGGIAKASMELVFAGKNRKTVHDSKEKLKARLAQKRKACLEGKRSLDATLFEVNDFSEKGIREKRKALLANVGAQVNISKNQEEIDQNQFQGKSRYARGMNWLDTNIIHRKDKENVATGYGEVNEKLAALMWETKKAGKDRNKNSVTENDEYKTKIHAMEALDILNEYEVENALAHRQNLKLRTNGFDLATNAAKLVGNVLQLSGEICTATGVGALAGGGLILTGSIIKTVTGLAEVSKNVGSFLNSELEQNSQRGMNKEYVRNEMGTALYEKMDILASIMKENTGWVTGTDDKAAPETKDFVITKIKNDFEYLVGVRRGSDMRVSSIMKANSRDDIISSLSSIFSQDGN